MQIIINFSYEKWLLENLFQGFHAVVALKMGPEGFEPPNSKEGGFTVRCSWPDFARDPYLK